MQLTTRRPAKRRPVVIVDTNGVVLTEREVRDLRERRRQVPSLNIRPGREYRHSH